MLKLVFLGPPGAGKGTQAKLLSERRQIAHISTGDMLRAAVKEGSDLGKRVQTIIDAGQLVPDDLIVDLIRERISQSDCERGFILDGFPRTVAQAQALQRMLGERGESLSKVVFFNVRREDIRNRLDHRRGNEARADDSAEVQEERLRIYQEQTAPLIEFYQNLGLLHRLEAGGAIEEVQERLVQSLVDE